MPVTRRGRNERSDSESSQLGQLHDGTQHASRSANERSPRKRKRLQSISRSERDSSTNNLHTPADSLSAETSGLELPEASMQTTQMYAALLAEHIQEHSIRLLGATFDFISPEEASENFGREDLDEAKPHAGGIAGPSWTDAELDRFFSALGRHSRLRPDLIAQDVGTKNIVQVTVYLSALAAGSAEVLLGETETPTRLDAWALKSSRRSRETRRRKRNLALRRKMPAAREVSAHWLAFEEREAQKVQELEDRLGARMAGADEAAYLKRDVGVRNVKGKEREIECSPEPMPACSQVSKLFEPIHFDEQVRAVVLFLRHRPALDPLQNTPNALACAPTIAPQPVHAFALSRVVQQLFRRSNQGNAAHVRREYELFARTHPVPPIQSYDDAWRVAYRAGELGFFVYYSRGTFGVPNDGVADASSTAEGRQSGDGTPLQGTAPVHEGRKPLPELTLLGGTGSSNRLPRKMSMLPEVAPYTSWRVSWTDAFFDVASATYAQSGPAHDDERATPNVPVPDASGDVQALLRTESRNAAICLAYVREQARARVLNTLDTQEMAWAEGRRGSARSRSRSMSKASSAAGSGSSSLAPDDASEPGGDASARGGLGKEGLRKVNEKLASKLRAGGADPTKRNGSPADASSGVEAGDGDGEGCMFHGFDLSALTPAARVRAKQRLRSRIKQHGLEAAQAMPFEVEKGRPKADATMISGLEHLLEGLEGDERRRVESRLRARVRKYGIEKTKSMPLGPAKRGRRKQGESLLPDGTDSEALTTQPGTPRGHGHGNGEGRSGNGASERSEAELAEIGEDGDETQGTTDVDGGRAVKRGSYRYRDGTQWSIGSKGRRFLAIGLDGTQSGGVAAPPSSLPPALGAANGMDDGASANSSVLGPAMEQELGWINLRSLSILLSRLPALDAPSGTGTPSTAAAKSNQRSQSSSISAHALLYLDANLRAFLTEILYEVLAVAERGGLRGGRDGRAAGRVVDAQLVWATVARLGYPHSLKHLVPPEQHYLTRDSTAGRPEGDAAAGVVANDPKVGAKGKIAAKANYNQQGSEGHFNSALLPALSASRMQRDPLASWAGSSTFDQASDGAAFHGLSAPHSASAAGPSSHGYLCETITAQSPYEVPIVFAGAELEDDHSAAGSDADDEASDQEHELTRSTRSAKLAHNRINAEGQELESEPDTGAESDSEPEPEPESNDEPSGLSSSYESQDEDEDEDEEDTGSDTEAPAHSISAPDGLRPSSVLGGQAKATLMDRYETAWWARMEQADREEDLVEEQKVWKDWFGIEVDVKMDNYESASACALVSPDEPAGGSGSGSALDDSNGALNASAGDGQEYQSADEEMNGNESRRTSIESDDDVHDTREIAMDQDLQMADSED